MLEFLLINYMKNSVNVYKIYILIYIILHLAYFDNYIIKAFNEYEMKKSFMKYLNCCFSTLVCIWILILYFSLRNGKQKIYSSAMPHFEVNYILTTVIKFKVTEFCVLICNLCLINGFPKLPLRLREYLFVYGNREVNSLNWAYIVLYN